MPTILPAQALVRPRVRSRVDRDARLLEDVISELVEEDVPGVVWIIGGPGCGKTTAAAHLAAIFDHLAVFDEPSDEEREDWSDSHLVVSTTPAPRKQRGIVLRLQAWTCDDLVEYLLAAYPAECKDVMQRLGQHARRSWSPQIARVVLDRFAADPTLSDPTDALLQEVREHLPTAFRFRQAEEICQVLLIAQGSQEEYARLVRFKDELPAAVFSMLRHREVQVLLAAERLVSLQSWRPLSDVLRRQLPIELIDRLGERCRDDRKTVKRLAKLLESGRHRPAHAMAASILLRVDPTWRPAAKQRGEWHLAGGYFENASWAEVDLAKADLGKATFTGAQLGGAILEEADASSACFASADLSRANLNRLRAWRANFNRANLTRARCANALFVQADFTEADLTGAALMKADLSGASLASALLAGADLTEAELGGAKFADAELSDAVLRDAHLAHADLREANLAGACLEGANLSHAQLEDVALHRPRLQFANLSHAYLTGSQFPAADLRASKLQGAHLAEIHWEQADLRGTDLRGATFHMGSSRSGLVGSPIAMEGSMTGFYTDDREEMHFKRPEEIRKANLRGADLRGARVDGVDFYLVDLRDARLDADQREQARRTGAILEDAEG